MFQRKQKRFRRHSNSRNHGSRDNGSLQTRLRPNSFSNGPTRNNFRPSLSAEKLYDKYSSLANEAMASGDKLLSENYLQHAEHFNRRLNELNVKPREQKAESTNLAQTSTEHLSKKEEAI